MANLNGFNAEEHKDEFTPVPAGTYTLMIVKSETKRTKDNSGSYLSLEMDIVEGQYKGRKIFENLNMENKNPETVKIAKATLASVCFAVGILHPKDSSELHLKPFTAKVGIKPEKDGYPASNKVTRYYPKEEAAPKVDFKAAQSKPWEKPAPKPEETPTF